MKKEIKKFISLFLDRTGYLNYKLNHIGENKILVLTYHRILPKNKIPLFIQPGMYVDEKTFEMHLKELNKYFVILNLKEFDDIFNNFNKKNFNKKKNYCLITFDDGWIDCYQYAYPILKKYCSPVLVFLPVTYIGTFDHIWTEKLSFILYYYYINNNISNFFYHMNKYFKMNMKKQLNDIIELNEILIKTLKKYKNSAINGFISENIKTKDMINLYNSYFSNRSFMNWNEIHELFKSGLFYFGSHTMNHEILTNLTKREIIFELKESHNILLKKGLIKNNILTVSYPNVSYNNTVINLAKSFQYKYGFIGGEGWNNLYSNPLTFSRKVIHQDVSYTRELFLCRILNLF